MMLASVRGFELPQRKQTITNMEETSVVNNTLAVSLWKAYDDFIRFLYNSEFKVYAGPGPRARYAEDIKAHLIKTMLTKRIEKFEEETE